VRKRISASGPKLIECSVRGNASHPGAEASRRIEPGASAIGTPKGFHQSVFCGTTITDDPQDPSKYLLFELPKQPLESMLITLHKSLEKGVIHLIGHRVYSVLLEAR
jgi:hypothetical protein